MRRSFFFIAVASLCLFCSCKKNTDIPTKRKTQFSFDYMDSTYNFSVNNNISNAGVIKESNGTAGISIDMPEIFGGRIEYTAAGCAYLAPQNAVIYVDYSTCQFSVKNSFGTIEPIDSTKVYVYQSGTLDISFSNCQGCSLSSYLHQSLIFERSLNK
jgi:hypothetical protein